MTQEISLSNAEKKQEPISTSDNPSVLAQSVHSNGTGNNQGIASHDLQTLLHPLNRNETKSKDETATYSDKTNRLIAWSEIIRNSSRFIWIIVIFIILTGIWGKFEASKTIATEQNREEEVVITIPLKAQISEDIAKAMTSALVSAKSVAGVNMENWKNQAMNRVDHPFLDWYYNYFTQWAGEWEVLYQTF